MLNVSLGPMKASSHSQKFVPIWDAPLRSMSRQPNTSYALATNQHLMSLALQKLSLAHLLDLCHN
jgi:hypothetical protein